MVSERKSLPYLLSRLLDKELRVLIIIVRLWVFYVKEISINTIIYFANGLYEDDDPLIGHRGGAGGQPGGSFTVQADPVIAARIVQVANSAMYAGVSQVESVQNAITRIGLQATRAIVTEAIAEVGASDPKEAGRVVGHIMKSGRDGLDGATVNRLVREQLGAD